MGFYLDADGQVHFPAKEYVFIERCAKGFLSGFGTIERGLAEMGIVAWKLFKAILWLILQMLWFAQEIIKLFLFLTRKRIETIPDCPARWKTLRKDKAMNGMEVVKNKRKDRGMDIIYREFMKGLTILMILPGVSRKHMARNT